MSTVFGISEVNLRRKRKLFSIISCQLISKDLNVVKVKNLISERMGILAIRQMTFIYSNRIGLRMGKTFRVLCNIGRVTRNSW